MILYFLHVDWFVVNYFCDDADHCFDVDDDADVDFGDCVVDCVGGVVDVDVGNNIGVDVNVDFSVAVAVSFDIAVDFYVAINVDVDDGVNGYFVKDICLWHLHFCHVSYHLCFPS